MRIKICGITKPDQGCAIAQMGATALGFICVPASKRYVSPQQIQAVIEQLLPNSIDRIGVFANSTLEEICQVISQTNLTGVQLHGDEPPEFCLQLRKLLPGVEIIKALRVGYSESQASPLQIAQRQAEIYSVGVDSLLLDAYHPQMLGGTGQTLNWEMLREFRPACAWFLAGGLTPDNVVEALKQVNPSGIDLSSGVEISPGDKDLTKVAKLFEVLKRELGSWHGA